MTEATYRSVVVFLLAAAVFCLAVMAATIGAGGDAWSLQLVTGLVYVGAIGMAAGVVLFFLAARER